MKKSRFLILLICLAVMGTAWAESITESQARSIAANFMASHIKGTPSLKMAHKAPQLGATSDKAAYYVFNATQGGYVIIAGDDRAPAVLGYSDQGTFDANDVPEAMQYMLEGYAAQIEALGHGFKAAPLLTANQAIRPLVPAVWSQNNPYNILLPIINGSHSAAGCVATAMAQLMYYWKSPARPTMAIPAYTTSTLGIEMPELPVIDFDWNAMQDTYETRDTTSAAALAAATLTLYCAQSVEMNYKGTSAGATTTRMPLVMNTYFGYKASAHSISRGNYTNQDWANTLYSEIAAGRPVVYSANKALSGHAFICDGYDGNGMFHINWGWNGQSNGYFLLNVLNPDQQGTGSATGAYGYIYSQAVIVGIEPGTGESGGVMLTTSDVTLDSYTATRTASNYNFSVTLSGKFHNYTSEVFAVNFGWGLYQGNTLVKVLSNSYNTALKPGSYLTHTNKILSFGANISSGTYRIVPICSEYGANNWKWCVGADMNYIEVTIDGNTCSYQGYGSAAEPDYTVNQVTYEGTLHNGRPVDIYVNMTNNGYSRNELLYMFVNGTFTSTSYVSLEKGETGIIPFRYLPTEAGTYTLTFSWNEDGSDPIASSPLTITAMPAASLTATLTVLNLNSSTKVITDDKFRVILNITNTGSTTYDEEISVKLFKHTYGTSGTNVQGKNQAIVLAPGATTTLEFDMDNVIDGWQYFLKSYYYSSGQEVSLKGTTTYTIVFPEMPQFILGDVDGNGQVEIADVSELIDYLLSGISTGINLQAADMDQDGEVAISDVSALIDFLLTN